MTADVISAVSAGYAVVGAGVGWLYSTTAGQRFRYSRSGNIRHERVPLTEAFAAGTLWPLILGFGFCLGFGRIVVRLMRLGPTIKKEVNASLKKDQTGSTALVVHDGREEVHWYE